MPASSLMRLHLKQGMVLKFKTMSCSTCSLFVLVLHNSYMAFDMEMITISEVRRKSFLWDDIPGRLCDEKP